jgi:hypothetical protein
MGVTQVTRNVSGKLASGVEPQGGVWRTRETLGRLRQTDRSPDPVPKTSAMQEQL